MSHTRIFGLQVGYRPQMHWVGAQHFLILSLQLSILTASRDGPLENLQCEQKKPWALSLKWVVLTWLSTSSCVPFDISQNKIMPSSSPKVLLSRGWMLYWFYLLSIMITYVLIGTNVYRFIKTAAFWLDTGSHWCAVLREYPEWYGSTFSVSLGEAAVAGICTW